MTDVAYDNDHIVHVDISEYGIGRIQVADEVRLDRSSLMIGHQVN